MTEKQRQNLFTDLLQIVRKQDKTLECLCQSAIRNISDKNSMAFAREAMAKQDATKEAIDAAISLIWKHFPKNEAQPSG